MVGVIEMCGLLMIALPARESHICEAGGHRENRSKRVLAVEEDGSKYSNFKLRQKKYGSAKSGHKCRNEPFDGDTDRVPLTQH